MKKTFPLTQPGKADARVLEAIKHEVRKYVKRERKKPAPADFDEWDFACKAGADQSSAEPTSLRDLSAAVDAVASSGSRVVYVEVLAVPMRRPPTRSTGALSTRSTDIPPVIETT